MGVLGFVLFVWTSTASVVASKNLRDGLDGYESHSSAYRNNTPLRSGTKVVVLIPSPVLPRHQQLAGADFFCV
jgi:hypothetical protein